MGAEGEEGWMEREKGEMVVGERSAGSRGNGKRDERQ